MAKSSGSILDRCGGGYSDGQCGWAGGRGKILDPILEEMKQRDEYIRRRGVKDRQAVRDTETETERTRQTVRGEGSEKGEEVICMW